MSPSPPNHSCRITPESAARSPGAVSDSWLLLREDNIKKEKIKYVDLGFIIVRRQILLWSLAALALSLLVAFVVVLHRVLPHHHTSLPPPDKYTVALHAALMFFNAQRAGPLPPDNNVTWRGNSGPSHAAGFYDAGSAAQYTFPASFALTMLSWSVVEYRDKYVAGRELHHVLDLISWGADHLLNSFNSSYGTVSFVVAQVGGGSDADRSPSDEFCWMRVEDVDYPRPVHHCTTCSDIAMEMAAALSSASIVFKDDEAYSERLIRAAELLWRFARESRGVYEGGDGVRFYNSTGFLDEFVWGGTWLYYATGNDTYFSALVDDFTDASAAGAFADPAYEGVLSWDKKLIAAKVLLTRLRMFLSPGYPYEEILAQFHNDTNIAMCSYLPYFTSFRRTKGGMILLKEHGPRPLQYAVNAAFLASLFSDYLETSDIPGWSCGPSFYSVDILRDFARTQINYILGDNPRNMSYVVGFGSRYPVHVHHRDASIGKSKTKYGCQEGWVWRDKKSPNPNTIAGAMVAGPDNEDGFHDDRRNYNYTEPTLAGNAGLVAALVSLSGESGLLDRNSMFSSIKPMFKKSPWVSPPWQP